MRAATEQSSRPTRFDRFAFERDGYATVESIVGDSALDTVAAAIDAARAARAPRDRAEAGVRHLLRDAPAVRTIAELGAIREVVRTVLGGNALLVRGIYFDKSPAANWSVGWHQDQTIAVSGRTGDHAGYGPWSERDGVTHVRPPESVLASMLTIRIHLDDCDEHNGPLRVRVGSHRLGRVDAAARLDLDLEPVTCTVRRGDAVLMRPLVVHSSPRATKPHRRRVIHLEFAAGPLPRPLRWACV